MHIGLFGLSGSGKTTLATMIATRNPELSITSASKLIREFGGVIAYDKLTYVNVKSNQEILVLAYSRHKMENSNTLIELHGIIETEEGIELIDQDIISKLKLDAVFFLKVAPDVIYERRRADSTKKRRIVSVEELMSLQDISLRHLQVIFGGHVIVIDESDAVMSIEQYKNSTKN